MKKALFLDRDGVINVDRGYVHTIKNFHFIDGIFELCRTALSKQFIIIVITNQAGIGRGYYSEEDFDILNNWMCNIFLANDIVITKVYYSPFHPIHGIGKYRKDENSRKPRPGMIKEAEKEFQLCLSQSALIGDNLTDIQAGLTAGVKKNILLVSNRKEFLEPNKEYMVATSLNEASALL